MHRCSCRLVVALAVVAVMVGVAGAQEEPQAKTSGDSSGFEDSFFAEVDSGEDSDEPSETETPGDSRFQLKGFVEQQVSYGYNAPDGRFGFARTSSGLTKLRSTLDLEAEVKLPGSARVNVNGRAFYDWVYQLDSPSDYPTITKGNLKDEAELREAYVEVGIGDNLWIKSGRQIIAWGESEILPIVDIANPRDDREFGQVDLAETRIPIAATKISFVQPRWQLDLALLHEFRHNKQAPPRADFDPYISIRGLFDVAPYELPDYDVVGSELLAGAYRSFAWGDLRLVYGEVYDDMPRLEIDGGKLVPRFSKSETTGFAVNRVKESWLLKLEVARRSRASILRDDWFPAVLAGQSDVQLYSDRPVTVAMVGFDYSGIENVGITFEVNGQRIDDYEPFFAEKEISYSTFTMVRTEHLHQKLETLWFWYHLGDGNGDILRSNITYTWTDNWEATIGLVEYIADDQQGRVFPFRKNDQLFCSVKLSF